MNDATNKVIIVDGLQNNLHIPLKEPRFREKFGFLSERLRCQWVWLTLGIKFKSWALHDVKKCQTETKEKKNSNFEPTRIPDTINVMW